MSSIRVGTRDIGPGRPCFLVAEIGINHNGDPALARAMIDAAAAAGADAVKFQSYRTEDFLSDTSLTYEYVSQGRPVVESQYDMFKRCELGPAAFRALAAHCAERGIVFFATPTSVDGVRELVDAGAPLLKNGSDFLLHLPLVRAMARTGLPTVLSTGMATGDEIADAVAAFRDAGGRHLVLLLCTSAYPTPAGDVHLRKLPALAAAFDCPVGFSDHTEGTWAAVGAVALGACMVEKHFTTDRALPGPDHRFSADPAEFAALAATVRAMEAALGQAALGPAASETEGRAAYRLSCVAARDLAAGETIAEADIAFRRPGTGMPPKLAARISGRRARRPVRQGEVFALEDLDG